MHQLVLDVSDLPKEKWTVESECCAHQVGSSILALLECTEADVDMSSNWPIKFCLLLAVGRVGKGCTTLLTQPYINT